MGTRSCKTINVLRLIEKMLPIDFANWQICEAQTSKSGGKTAAVLGAKGEPICFTLPALRSPFDASAYNDETATRVNLSLEVDPENQDIVEWCEALDSWVLQYCSKNCRRLFGKEYLAISELRPLYYSPLRRTRSMVRISSKLSSIRGLDGTQCVFGIRVG